MEEESKIFEKSLGLALNQNQQNRLKRLAREHGIDEILILNIVVNAGLKWMEKGIE